eukprot:354941-Chlamydomonas_euryale.AAC.4
MAHAQFSVGRQRMGNSCSMHTNMGTHAAYPCSMASLVSPKVRQTHTHTQTHRHTDTHTHDTQTHTCTKHSSRPQVEAYHAHVHALRPRAVRGRGRRVRPRPEAETSMFCARMTLPRFHMRVNAMTGPPCTQHRQDLRSNKCMHERTHMHQTCMLHYPGIYK